MNPRSYTPTRVGGTSSFATPSRSMKRVTTANAGTISSAHATALPVPKSPRVGIAAAASFTSLHNAGTKSMSRTNGQSSTYAHRSPQRGAHHPRIPSQEIGTPPQSHLNSGLSNATGTTPQNTPPNINQLSPSSVALVPSASDNVHVAVRVRNFLDKEHRRREELAVRMKDQTCAVRLPNGTHQPFTFDHCLWSNDVAEEEKPYVDQQSVYEIVGKPLVEHALNGFNATVIAYGQTGSGKTYSLYGPECILTPINSEPGASTGVGFIGSNTLHADKGLIPRISENLFQKLYDEQIPYKATVSMIEVYMERVYDLLDAHKELVVRGDLTRGFHVMGSKKIEVTRYQDIEKVLQTGEIRKTYGSTAVNDRSSRAHTLFEITLRCVVGNHGVRASRITLVDLAGCERVKDSKTEGKAFEQACNINLSLLHLGRCIEAVVTRNGAPVTEYRHSVLTKLLKESLGGNSKTMILCTISPCASDYQNTLHALRFADRAKQIKNHAVINRDTTHPNSEQYTEELRKVFEEKMKALRLEYELECREAEIDQRQAHIEEESSRLVAERAQLQQQREFDEKLSLEERRQIENREAELEVLMATLTRELLEAQKLRDEVDVRRAEMSNVSEVLQNEKKIVEEEVHALQVSMAAQTQAHEEEMLDRTRMAARAEEQLRIAREEFQAEREELLSQLESTRQYHLSQIDLLESRLDNERRQHQSDLRTLQDHVTQLTEDARSEVDRHTNEVETMVCRHEEQSRSADQRIQSMMTQLRHLQELHRELNREKEALQRAVDEQTSTIQNLLTKEDRRVEERAQLDKHLEELSLCCKNLDAQLRTRTAELHAARAEVERMGRAQVQLQERVDEEAQRRRSTRNQLVQKLRHAQVTHQVQYNTLVRMQHLTECELHARNALQREALSPYLTWSKHMSHVMTCAGLSVFTNVWMTWFGGAGSAAPPTSLIPPAVYGIVLPSESSVQMLPGDNDAFTGVESMMVEYPLDDQDQVMSPLLNTIAGFEKSLLTEEGRNSCPDSSREECTRKESSSALQPMMASTAPLLNVVPHTNCSEAHESARGLEDADSQLILENSLATNRSDKMLDLLKDASTISVSLQLQCTEDQGSDNDEAANSKILVDVDDKLSASDQQPPPTSGGEVVSKDVQKSESSLGYVETIEVCARELVNVNSNLILSQTPVYPLDGILIQPLVTLENEEHEAVLEEMRMSDGPRVERADPIKIDLPENHNTQEDHQSLSEPMSPTVVLPYAMDQDQDQDQDQDSHHGIEHVECILEPSGEHLSSSPKPPTTNSPAAILPLDHWGDMSILDEESHPLEEAFHTDGVGCVNDTDTSTSAPTMVDSEACPSEMVASVQLSSSSKVNRIPDCVDVENSPPRTNATVGSGRQVNKSSVASLGSPLKRPFSPREHNRATLASEMNPKANDCEAHAPPSHPAHESNSATRNKYRAKGRGNTAGSSFKRSVSQTSCVTRSPMVMTPPNRPEENIDLVSITPTSPPSVSRTLVMEDDFRIAEGVAIAKPCATTFTA